MKFRKSKIIWQKQERLIENYVAGSTAHCTVVSDFKHMWINYCKKFVDGYNHINGIENFWNQATNGWAKHRVI